MKSRLIVFVLLIVSSSLVATRCIAQTRALQPISEVQAERDAYLLSEEINRNELPNTDFQKNDKRSADAMKWKPFFVNQESKPVVKGNQPLPSTQKATTVKSSAHKQQANRLEKNHKEISR